MPWDDAGQFVRFSATFLAPTLADEERVLTETRRRLSVSTFVF